jgi:MFS family permease
MRKQWQSGPQDVERKRTDIRLGLQANLLQFSLLVLVNAFVGAMAGLERSILPALAEQEFQLAARSAILSFIAVFGLTKALTNYAAGRWSDRFGRKPVLVAGWLIAVPVPFLLMWAPSWSWVIVANGLLGASQGLTWSTTVIMKIDLVGPAQRGLAMGLNEFAGYVAVAANALATGWLAAAYGLRPEPFYLGVAYVVAGGLLAAFAVQETRHHVAQESSTRLETNSRLGAAEVFQRATWKDRNLSTVSQVGLVNNMNDGMAWGLFPLWFAAAGLSLAQTGWLVAIYPAVWGMSQIGTGVWSDRIGRKPLIVSGMVLQAIGIALTTISATVSGFAIGGVLLGLGTAAVYPTLLAAIGDVADPSWRASAVGVYRLWRDLGYVVGALVAGVIADVFGLAAAMWTVALLTLASGLWAQQRLCETLRRA